MKSLSTIVERSLQYVWWMYPVIWLFWPQDYNCTCCSRKKKRRNINDDFTESRVSTSVNHLSTAQNTTDEFENRASDNLLQKKPNTYITPEEAALIQQRNQNRLSKKDQNPDGNFVMSKPHHSSSVTPTNDDNDKQSLLNSFMRKTSNVSDNVSNTSFKS